MCGMGGGGDLGIAKIADLDQWPGSAIQQGVLQFYITICHALHPVANLALLSFRENASSITLSSGQCLPIHGWVAVEYIPVRVNPSHTRLALTLNSQHTSSIPPVSPLPLPAFSDSAHPSPPSDPPGRAIGSGSSSSSSDIQTHHRLSKP